MTINEIIRKTCSNQRKTALTDQIIDFADMNRFGMNSIRFPWHNIIGDERVATTTTSPVNGHITLGTEVPRVKNGMLKQHRAPGT